MSIEAMAAVLHHSRARGTNKLILLGIANHDGDGGAWPTIETLGRYGACSRSKVKQAIQELVAMGELRVDIQAGGNSDTRADRRPNRYTVLVSCPQDCDGSTKHRQIDGGQWSDPRDDGGQKQTERGSLFDATGVTRLTPNHPLEPSMTEPSFAAPAVADAQATEGQRVNALTRTYTDQVPLSNFPAIAGIVRKAVRTGRYSDEQIIDALTRMAEDNRPVTTDALRIELEGVNYRTRRKSGTQMYLEASQRLDSRTSNLAIAALGEHS
jgi:predicted nucleic acid-binding protein